VNEEEETMRWRSLTVVLGALLIGAGCGGASTSSDPIPAEDTAALGGEDSAAELERLYKAANEAGENQVIVYGAGELDRQPVYRAFQKRFPGIRVRAEQISGPQLTSRVEGEMASGKHVADLSQTGDTTTVDFADKGWFAPYAPRSASGLGEQWADSQGRFRAAAAALFGIAYNTDQVSEAEAPKSWNDVLDPKWRGKMAMEDPTHAGPSQGVLTRLLYDDGYDEDWLRRLAGQDATLLPGTPEVGSALATGQHPLAPVYPYSFYLRDKKKNAPIGFVFPVQGGNQISGHYLALMKGAPHPNAAKLLYAWLFTPEGQKQLAGVGLYTTMPGSPAPGGFPTLDRLDVLKAPPFNETLKVARESIGTLKKVYR
jgi:iron(III) transport system substrate-binding protein